MKRALSYRTYCRCIVLFSTLGGLLANATGQATIVLKQGFDGPVETAGVCGFVNPPDPTIAVGPSHVLVTVNTYVYVYDKNGSPACLPPSCSLSLEKTTGLFRDADACPVAHPRCIYDHYTDQFVVIALRISPAHIFIAVSPPGQPTDFANWIVRDISTSASADFPGLGYDDSYYYVTAKTDTSLYGSSRFLAFAKDLSTFGSFLEADAGTVQPAIMFDASVGTPYGYLTGVTEDTSTGDKLIKIYAWDKALNQFHDKTTVLLNPGWVNPEPSTTPSCSRTLAAPQQDALRNAVYRFDGTLNSGMLYAAHPVKNLALKTQVQWFEVRLNGWPDSAIQPDVVASATFAGNTVGSMPAITRSSSGKLAMVMATTGDGIPPGVGVTGRLPGITSLFSSVTNAKTGLCDVKLSDFWGDFYGIAVDPTDDTFWAFGEYFGTVDIHGNQSWKTWIQNFDVQ